MEICNIIFSGVKVVVPVVNGSPLHIPHDSFEDFDTYCGPGKWGDKFVSDCIFSVPMNLPCFIHDEMYEHAQALWSDFYQANWVFFKNMLTVADYFKSPLEPDEYRYARYGRICLYYQSVDSDWGRDVFFKGKISQGHRVIV
jgi:hypothetical protein